MTVYANVDLSPFTMVAYVEARFGQQWVSGSGVLVGRNDVLTAAHVIHDPVHGLADEVNVYFSYDPKVDSTSFSGVYFHYYDNYDPDGDGRLFTGDGSAATLGGSELDIALISLSSAVGDVRGWMDMDFSFTTGQANLTGHPGAYGRQMTNDTDLAARDARDHSIDIGNFEVNSGNSGGPVWYMGADGPEVAGLVSTKIAAVSLSGHDWLLSAVSENDRFIQNGPEINPVTGDSVFIAQASQTSYVGSAGFDSLQYSGTRDVFMVAFAGPEAIHVRRPDGKTDTLSSIEKVAFDDGALLFDLPHGIAEQTYRMYQAAFGRTPDEGGLLFWVDRIESLTGEQPEVSPLAFLATQFLGADEFRNLFGANPTETAYVDALYRNVLLRAPEQTGYDFWLDQLDQGTSRADLLIAFSESGENMLNVAQDLTPGFWVV